MLTPYEKLSALLKELFQLDQADLDFGIYRIMNQKREEITRFLDHDLLPQVKAAFEQYRPADKKVLEGELQKALQGAEALGVEPDSVPKVKELREQIAHYSVDSIALENEVYSHLYSFFRRYYDNGDFISQRRYKEGVYAILYEGEEVKLHWANADQYYVKTTENFRDYAFRLPSGRLAHFKIVEAETEKDNVKADAEKERRFILAPEAPIAVEGDTLILRFEYRSDPEKRDQKTLNTQAAEAILARAPAEWAADLKTLAPTESSPKRSLLEKRLADYTARNTFDYFIHKNLRGFLNRELDFYIKNEVMRLDDIEDESAPQVEQYLSKIKVIRTVAHKIIEFLAQIEDFQKKLWLKKKFVVETNYCITLDRVPEALYPEICANDAQREEWVRLFAIDEITGEQPAQPELGATLKPGYSVPLTVEFLKANPFLVLDTKFFDRQFVGTLLARIEIIDEQTDGQLVYSENFQALGFLQPRFTGKVQCMYIDPPYNTGGDSFIYKDGFVNSSWLSLINDRVYKSKILFKDDGVFFVSIDDNEDTSLGNLLKSIFIDGFVAKVIVQANKGGQDYLPIAKTHEYMYVFFSGNTGEIFLLPKDDVSSFKFIDEKGKYELRELRNRNPKFNRANRPNLYFSIYINTHINDDYDCYAISLQRNEEYSVEVFPVNSIGIDGCWRWGRELIDRNITRDNPISSNVVAKQRRDGGWNIYEKNRKTLTKAKTIWDETEVRTEQGTIIQRQLFGKDVFPHPKPVELLEKSLKLGSDEEGLTLDYFAGSGTTGHAVINLNREDGGHRKYILVEMGEYFNTVLKPRIQKVIYSKDWKDGKPVSREGSSHCFKYLRLESYEDALNNLSLQRTKEQQLALDAAPEFKENYLLSYILDVESQGSLLNIQSFAHPFDYQLNIAAGTVGESQPTKVDLVETFNYLIGLHVETLQVIRGFHVVTGKNPAGERTLVIWRDLEAKSNKDLEEFFRKQDYNPRDMEFDLIYVNGDNNLENLRRPDETWKVRLIEEEFLKLMFDTKDQ